VKYAMKRITDRSMQECQSDKMIVNHIERATSTAWAN